MAHYTLKSNNINSYIHILGNQIIAKYPFCTLHENDIIYTATKVIRIKNVKYIDGRYEANYEEITE